MNVKTLRVVGILEGISFLLLLGVAMPIKYIWDNPVAVKYIGMGHGVLFLFFLGLLLIVCHRMRWSLSVFVLGLVAAILPMIRSRPMSGSAAPPVLPWIRLATCTSSSWSIWSGCTARTDTCVRWLVSMEALRGTGGVPAMADRQKKRA